MLEELRDGGTLAQVALLPSLSLFHLHFEEHIVKAHKGNMTPSLTQSSLLARLNWSADCHCDSYVYLCIYK